MAAPDQTLAGEIALAEVAADAREMLRALRENPAPAITPESVATARDAYEATSARNGLPKAALHAVRDHGVPVRDSRIMVREYRPTGAPVLPAILFLHGGGWVIGSLDTHDSICRHLARESGAAVFAAGYRLAPEHPFPVPLHDCADALAWLVDEASGLGIDAGSVAVAGDSAGGNLAAALANSHHLRPRGFDFRARVLFYPVVDLSCERASYARIRQGFTLVADSMRRFRDFYVPARDLWGDPDVSPILSPTLSRSPLFIVSCGFDPLCDEDIDFACASARAGAPVEHIHMPRHGHGIVNSSGLIPSGKVLASRAAAFLRESLATREG